MALKTMLAAMATGMAASVALAADPPDSRFISGLDKWTTYGDAQGFRWNDVLGVPAGCLEAVDAQAGSWWGFAAPAHFLGNQSAMYGGTLSFDVGPLSVDGTGADQADVTLKGGGVTIVIDLPNPVAGFWNFRSVRLSGAAGWRVNTLSGRAATESEVRAVLGSMDSLSIRGEFATGPDQCFLDNVRLERCPTDFNADGRVDSDDFFDFLNGYLGGGC